MIITTGSCRTGTSMVMQSLRRIGVDVLGNKFEQFHRECLNPHGYYDAPKEYRYGVDRDMGRDVALKLFGGQLLLSNASAVEKLIVCVRNISDVVRSTIRAIRAMPDVFRGVLPIESCAREINNLNYDSLWAWIVGNKVDVPLIVVDYDVYSKNNTLLDKHLAMFVG